MANTAPPIDERTEKEIAEQVRSLLATYAPAWKEFDPATGQPQGVSRALISIFARDVALIIQRLNQAPHKNLLAFLDLLGAALLPPEPARVPLTFFLAAGSATDAIVPPGTQAAAPPVEGETEPVIFETERGLTVTATQLASLWVRDPEKDQFADQSAILTAPSGTGFPVFQGQRTLEHILYIGNEDLFGYPMLQSLQLIFALEQNLPTSADLRTVQWETWDGAHWRAILTGSLTDGTSNLTKSAAVIIKDLSQVPQQTINRLPTRWLRARLTTPITPDAAQQTGMVRAGQLPTIKTVTLKGTVNRSGLPIEHAFSNVLPVELSKDFFPFGEKPKFGDTLYLANAEAFSQAGATITLHVTLTNPTPSGITAPKTDGGATLTWEYWDGNTWASLGTSNVGGAVTGTVVTDDTKAFTAPPPNPPMLTRDVKLTFPPQPPAPATVNGIASYWIRVRLSGGNYGVEAKYIPDASVPAGFRFVPATFGPPSIGSISAEYSVTKEASPDKILTCNDFVYIAPTTKFDPFQPTLAANSSLYLGFTLAQNQPKFPNRTLSLYCRVADRRYGETSVPISPERSVAWGKPGVHVKHNIDIVNSTALPLDLAVGVLGTHWVSTPDLTQISLTPGQSRQVQVDVTIPSDAPIGRSDRGWLRLWSSSDPVDEVQANFVTFSGSELPTSQPPRLVWEYWNGSGWVKLAVNDETGAFTRSGLVEFLPPADLAPGTEFGLSQYWVRARWDSGDYKFIPKLRAILLNTTTAAQTLTLTNETLGSSNGSEDQTFRTSRAPVLNGQQMQVREPELPSAAEQKALQAKEGADSLAITTDAPGRPREIWVRWHDVPDFYASGPRDRHYVFDHLTGELHFGDGRNGLIPPIGTGNIRMARYQTGGGVRGNRAARTIIQLKTTVPYVDKVINHDAASKGADAETLDSLIARAPRTIRHRNRAVTFEDYQDLAMLASPEVARAKCVPLFDLAADPDATRQVPGTISLILVPRSILAKPLVSLELLNRVQSYLDAHRVPTCDLVVVGPDYVRVDVQVEIALSSLDVASGVESAVTVALSKFLHPLTGGLDDAGWDFGRQPHKSDVYALLEPIPGVDHVHSLSLKPVPDRPGADRTDRFLVYAGTIATTLIYEET